MVIASESETDPEDAKLAKERAKRNAKKKKQKQKKKQSAGQGPSDAGGEPRRDSDPDDTGALKASTSEPTTQSASVPVPSLQDRSPPKTSSASVAEQPLSASVEIAPKALLDLAAATDLPIHVGGSRPRDHEEGSGLLAPSPADAPIGSGPDLEQSEAEEPPIEMPPAPKPAHRTIPAISTRDRPGTEPATSSVAGSATSAVDPLIGLGISLGLDPVFVRLTLNSAGISSQDDPANLAPKAAAALEALHSEVELYDKAIQQRLSQRSVIEEQERKDRQIEAASSPHVEDDQQSARPEQKKEPIVAEEKADQPKHPEVKSSGAEAVTEASGGKKAKKGKKNKKTGSKPLEVEPEKQPGPATTDQTAKAPTKKPKAIKADGEIDKSPSIDKSAEPAVATQPATQPATPQPVDAQLSTVVSRAKEASRAVESNSGTVALASEGPDLSGQQAKKGEPLVSYDAKTSPQTADSADQPAAKADRQDLTPTPPKTIAIEPEKPSAVQPASRGQAQKSSKPSGGQGVSERTAQSQSRGDEGLPRKDPAPISTEPDRPTVSLQKRSRSAGRAGRRSFSDSRGREETALPPWELVGVKKTKIKREPTKRLDEAASKIPGSKAWVADARGRAEKAKVADAPRIVITAPAPSETMPTPPALNKDKVISEKPVTESTLLAPPPARPARPPQSAGLDRSTPFLPKATGSLAASSNVLASRTDPDQSPSNVVRPPVTQPISILTRKGVIAIQGATLSNDDTARESQRDIGSKPLSQKEDPAQKEAVMTKSADEIASLLDEVTSRPVSPIPSPGGLTPRVGGTLAVINREDTPTAAGSLPTVDLPAPSTKIREGRSFAMQSPGPDVTATEPRATIKPQNDRQQRNQGMPPTEITNSSRPGSTTPASPSGPDSPLSTEGDTRAVFGDGRPQGGPAASIPQPAGVGSATSDADVQQAARVRVNPHPSAVDVHSATRHHESRQHAVQNPNRHRIPVAPAQQVNDLHAPRASQSGSDEHIVHAPERVSRVTPNTPRTPDRQGGQSGDDPLDHECRCRLIVSALTSRCCDQGRDELRF